MHATQYALLALAGFAAGAVNALAGGGTLISFPVLMALGVPAISANLSNTIALCPGYLGATLAQRAELRGQGARFRALLPVALAGGLGGAWLLLHTGERAFTAAVPWLILLACALLAVQDRVRNALAARGPSGATTFWLLPLLGLAAVYGGYFGAGMGVMLLAVLGLMYTDTLPRINALKQAVSLAANLAAAVLLALSAPVNGRLIAVLSLSALLGGAAGGRLARRLSAPLLRGTMVLLGVAIAAVYLLRRA